MNRKSIFGCLNGSLSLLIDLVGVRLVDSSKIVQKTFIFVRRTFFFVTTQDSVSILKMKNINEMIHQALFIVEIDSITHLCVNLWLYERFSSVKNSSNNLSLTLFTFFHSGFCCLRIDLEPSSLRQK